MADINIITPHLADLQRRATEAIAAVPQTGWDPAREAADALRIAIDESGLEREHGSWTFHGALKAAARELADAA